MSPGGAQNNQFGGGFFSAFKQKINFDGTTNAEMNDKYNNNGLYGKQMSNFGGLAAQKS